ncbi:MAG: nickel-dependent hydrogenase large subunit [Propionibacteriaceae bacterium]|jgi:NAD-reducing hydrogenase large subunit|nr:nickel-dependent hydrogenase large subunit [Propionibacteriaceae bacterium]
MRLDVDQLVEGVGARIIVSPRGARFDLSDFPRIDASLAGRPVSEVPKLVERICGACPAAHHLAGVAALEMLAGLTVPQDAARARRLLHYGSVAVTNATTLLNTDIEAAMALRRFGLAAQAAAGSPGHFPITAAPGGVAVGVDRVKAQEALGLAKDAQEAAVRLFSESLDDKWQYDPFTGCDFALVDADGFLDPLGSRLRARSQAGQLLAEIERDFWAQAVVETDPGSPSPRPRLAKYGRQGHYRVGPIAQARVGIYRTPRAAELQEQWLKERSSAGAARALAVLHAVEAAVLILKRMPDPVPSNQEIEYPSGIGVGWIDGARGLLVHQYEVAGGKVESAQILTPTAQNEYWLAQMLTNVAACEGLENTLRFEEAIRAADPCLPCAQAAPGEMGLEIYQCA